MFGKRVLQRIFGPKREEGTGGEGKLNEELHNVYGSVNIIISRTMRWPGDVARMGEMRSLHKI
jgi:hypothetical protein